MLNNKLERAYRKFFIILLLFCLVLTACSSENRAERIIKNLVNNKQNSSDRNSLLNKLAEIGDEATPPLITAYNNPDYENSLRDLADAIQTGKISRNSAKNALYEIVKTGNELSKVMSDLDLGNVSDESELLTIIKDVISEEPQAVEQARSNPQTINYLVGKVMQKTKGKADPKLTLDLLKKQIE